MTTDVARITCPRYLPADVGATWQRLDSATALPSDRIDPKRLDELPVPVKRWLRHAIAADVPPCQGAKLSMHGEIKIGKWRPFAAQQIIAPGGFIWAADAGRFPLRIQGFDRYTDGSGLMRWRLFGLIPVMSASGDDTTRSAAGRLAGETVLVPAAALGDNVTWTPGDDHHATATIVDGAFRHQVSIEIDDAGSLRAVWLPRWGNPDKQDYREHCFGVEMSGEQTFGGYAVPGELSAGWWYGSDRWSDGEFFRCAIDDAEFF